MWLCPSGFVHVHFALAPGPGPGGRPTRCHTPSPPPPKYHSTLFSFFCTGPLVPPQEKSFLTLFVCSLLNAGHSVTNSALNQRRPNESPTHRPPRSQAKACSLRRAHRCTLA